MLTISSSASPSSTGRPMYKRNASPATTTAEPTASSVVMIGRARRTPFPLICQGSKHDYAAAACAASARLRVGFPCFDRQESSVAIYCVAWYIGATVGDVTDV